jgi:cell division protease FtsH
MIEEEMMDEGDLPEAIYDLPPGFMLLSNKNRDTIDKFLGRGQHSVEVYSADWYYVDLLSWTVNRLVNSPGWKIVSVLGYSRDNAVYRDIQTDYTRFESCLVEGQMLVEKGYIRFVFTLCNWRQDISCVQIDAAIKHQDLVKQLILDIKDSLKHNNFYRGKKICLDSDVSFLNIKQKDWDSIILDPAVKKEIHRNTIGFLKNKDRLEKYGIPSHRGIILVGEPGTGKTVICKALMSEAENITCITTTARGMLHGKYITDMFILASELSPSMVFIEDLDFIGQERNDFNRGNPALITLLAEMDGIGEKEAIV